MIEELRIAAAELGFPLFGVVPAGESPGFSRFCDWLDRGYAGTMDYLPRRRDAYRHPESVLAGVKSLVMLGMPYSPAKSRRRRKGEVGEESLSSRERDDPSRTFQEKASVEANPSGVQPSPRSAAVAAYATGVVDYHDLIHGRLKELGKRLVSLVPNAQYRGVVDSAPLLEREFAMLAGLGWIGKNTLLIHRSTGSYFFLAALLTNVEFEVTTRIESDHCGTCTACLDACPTQAFPSPRVLNASRCISYLTIEHRGSIPLELREDIGNWIFGAIFANKYVLGIGWRRERRNPS